MVSEWYFDDILDSLYRSKILNGISITTEGTIESY